MGHVRYEDWTEGKPIFESILGFFSSSFSSFSLLQAGSLVSGMDSFRGQPITHIPPGFEPLLNDGFPKITSVKSLSTNDNQPSTTINFINYLQDTAPILNPPCQPKRKVYLRKLKLTRMATLVRIPDKPRLAQNTKQSALSSRNIMSSQQTLQQPRVKGKNESQIDKQDLPIVPRLPRKQNLAQPLLREEPKEMTVDDIQQYLDNPNLEKQTFLAQYYYASAVRKSPDKNIKLPSPWKEIKCTLCPERFSSSFGVASHLMGHIISFEHKVPEVGRICNLCLQEVGTDKMKRHLEIEHYMLKQPHTCLICKITFATERFLITHMWTRHRQHDMPYCCELCEFRTSTLTALAAHFDETHGDLAVLLCPVCSAVLSCHRRDDLKNIFVHMQMHFLKQGFKCEHCALTFSSEEECASHSSHVLRDYHDMSTPGNREWSLTPFPVAASGCRTKMPIPPCHVQQINMGYRTLPPRKRQRLLSLTTSKPRNPPKAVYVDQSDVVVLRSTSYPTSTSTLPK